MQPDVPGFPVWGIEKSRRLALRDFVGSKMRLFRSGLPVFDVPEVAVGGCMQPRQLAVYHEDSATHRRAEMVRLVL